MMVVEKKNLSEDSSSSEGKNGTEQVFYTLYLTYILVLRPSTLLARCGLLLLHQHIVNQLLLEQEIGSIQLLNVE